MTLFAAIRCPHCGTYYLLGSTCDCRTKLPPVIRSALQSTTRLRLHWALNSSPSGRLSFVLSRPRYAAHCPPALAEHSTTKRRVQCTLSVIYFSSKLSGLSAKLSRLSVQKAFL